MYSELWICIKDGFNNGVSGRISFDCSNGEERQFVELVDGTYPRKLENVKCMDDGSCLWQRYRWNTRYELLHDASFCEANTKMFLFKEIEKRRKYLDAIWKYSNSIGIRSISFDFVISNGRFSIIDWDSENDIVLVSSVLRKIEA